MNQELVAYGEHLGASDIARLETLCASPALQSQVLGLEVARLALDSDVSRAAVAEQCAAAQLDHAIVEAGARLADIGLVAMDMDSTLITIECIDEIADFAGRKAEVAEVTARAMRGEIDWPESLRQRVSALAGLPATVLDEIDRNRLKLTPGAEALVAAAKAVGTRLLLVSGGFTFFTERLKVRLGLDFAHANTLEIADGRLTGRVLGELCDAQAKARHLSATAARLGLAQRQCLAIGDGANDLPMMAAAGYSIAYRAKPVVRSRASAAINATDLRGVLAIFPA